VDPDTDPAIDAARENRRYARRAAEQAVAALTGWLSTAAVTATPGRDLYLMRCLLLAATDGRQGPRLTDAPRDGEPDPVQELITGALTFAGYRHTPPVTREELLGMFLAIFHADPGDGAEIDAGGRKMTAAAYDPRLTWLPSPGAPGGQGDGVL
jgi:hypothetical protein